MTQEQSTRSARRVHTPMPTKSQEQRAVRRRWVVALLLALAGRAMREEIMKFGSVRVRMATKTGGSGDGESRRPGVPGAAFASAGWFWRAARNRWFACARRGPDWSRRGERLLPVASPQDPSFVAAFGPRCSETPEPQELPHDTAHRPVAGRGRDGLRERLARAAAGAARLCRLAGPAALLHSCCALLRPAALAAVLAGAALAGFAGSVQAQTTVPNDWSLVPSGLADGDEFRLLFVTSGTRDGSSSNIANYNTFVQNAAANGHTDIRDYSSQFKAVASTPDDDARDNTATTYTSADKGVRIYWLNGNRVANQYEDFYDGSWDDEANAKNESGGNHSVSTQPWTGSDSDGTEDFTTVTNAREPWARPECDWGIPERQR